MKPLTNKQILAGVLNGSNKRVQDKDGWYYCLLKFTSDLIPNKVFISGIMSLKDPDKDTTNVTESIPGRASYRKPNPKGFTYGWYLKRYGFSCIFRIWRSY
jgi:hypothetical protein